MKIVSVKALAGLIGLAIAAGCGGGAPPTSNPSLAGTESASEVVAAGLVGSVIASDTLAGSVGLRSSLSGSKALARVAAEVLAPSALASSTCPTAPFGRSPSGAISGRTVTLDYSNCTPPGDPSAHWNGTQYLTFDSSTGLTAYTAGTLSSGYVTRTFGGGIGSTAGLIFPNLPTYRTGLNETFVYLVSNASDVICYKGASGCSPTPAPAGASAPASDYGVTTQFAGASTRAVTINGLRMVGAVALSDTVPSWDYTIISGPITVNGYGATKSIKNGTITLFNNMKKYSATVTLTNLSWGAVSCYPVSGQVSTTCKTGSSMKNEIMSYNGTSQASLIDCDGVARNVILQCT